MKNGVNWFCEELGLTRNGAATMATFLLLGLVTLVISLSGL